MWKRQRDRERRTDERLVAVPAFARVESARKALVALQIHPAKFNSRGPRRRRRRAVMLLMMSQARGK